MNESPNNDQLLQDLVKRVEALEREAPKNQLALGVMSGDLDHTMAAFMVALGATTFDMEVEMFFMFWGTAALRDPKKKVEKEVLDSMFGMMLPNGAGELPVSTMQSFGMGPSMLNFALKKHGAMSLEELIEEAGEAGVRITVCAMSMDIMGIKREELIDYPHLTFAGVGTFVDMLGESKQCWFM